MGEFLDIFIPENLLRYDLQIFSELSNGKIDIILFSNHTKNYR